MFTQFFGNYLLNKGLVKPDNLSQALSAQKNTRLKLGVLAINAGYMTAAQVDAVHAKQQTVDKRIGDIACEMGFLTQEQISELLSSQGAAHLKLGQALVDMGAMSNAEFESALSSYKQENSLTDVDFSGDSSEKIKGLISKFYNFSELDNENLYTEYITLLFKNIIRFIGDDFTPCAPIKSSSAATRLCSAQEMTGAFGCVSAIEGSSAAYIGFASRYAGEELTEADEMTDAANGEFLNLHNGLFSVNMSNDLGKEIKLTPQQTIHSGSISGSTVYTLPLVFPFGTVNVILVVK